MRTTIALDDELIAKAEAFTGLKEKSSLVRGGGTEGPHLSARARGGWRVWAGPNLV